MSAPSGCQLYQGDALTILRDLPDGCADALVTDPPYSSGGQFRSDKVQAGGWIWRGIIPWHKTNARCFAGRFTNHCEYVVWASKGALPNPSNGGRAYPGIYTESSPRDRLHQTQKPVALIENLLAPVRDGGTVLDPFMGSGTTGVAALNTGRKFIGIEMSEHFYGVAVDRIHSTAPTLGGVA